MAADPLFLSEAWAQLVAAVAIRAMPLAEEGRLTGKAAATLAWSLAALQMTEAALLDCIGDRPAGCGSSVKHT
jgi:hypothetical protein